MSNSTMACMIPATGVRPPLLMLVMVRAMAPVTGMPPKNGTMMFAAPCAMSSVLELCLSPVTPSATVADSSDSMAPSIAMVNAGGSSSRIVSRLNEKPVGAGIVGLILYRSPMVSMASTPAKRLSRKETTVTMMIAASDPGILRDTFGVSSMISMLIMPVPSDQRLVVPKCRK